jgi:alanine racemase
MSSYSLQKIAEITSCTLKGNGQLSIRYLLTDSRSVSNPSESLFVAIRGVRHDGHRYISDLYNAGVRAFIVEDSSIANRYPDAGFIVAANALVAFQKLAAWHRDQFSGAVLAITGSNGKTIVKEWLYQALHTDKLIVRSPKSYNSQVGVPLSVWQIEKQHEVAIIEAGISEPGEMERLERIIRPTVGIITNIGEPHQKNFSDYAHKCNEKLLLFKHCKTLIYCSDHELIDEALRQPAYDNLEKISWSVHKPATVRIAKVDKQSGSTNISGIYHSSQFDFVIPFTDDASIENSIHVASYLFLLGYTPQQVKDRMISLSPVAMRLELKQGINNCTIINDSYNSDLRSLSIAIDALCYQNQHGKKTVILSDILQSGKSLEELYCEVGEILKEKNIDRFIGIGPNISSCPELFGVNSQFFASTDRFLERFDKKQFSNEGILLKGSRTFAFERILKELEEKAHETVMEINLTNMVHNLNYFRSKLKHETKMVAMVKAFSYGSGTFEIANILQYQRVDYLAVAFADEGVLLREAGIAMPVMVMNPEASGFDQLIRYRLEPEIFSFNVLEQFASTLAKQGVTHFPVHLKVDTGMHRLGFMEPELDQLTEILKSRTEIQVKSIFSHLAGADEAQFDEFTRQQINVFERMSSRIQKSLPYPVLRHILNSAGIERFPEAQYDMVRLGIGLYGISAVDNNLVKQVSTLKTVILQIKDIAPNETVGYSRRFTATSPTRIGIVPVGYADGLHRSLGNGVGRMLVNGQQVPIIGSICMDMCMLDLTNVEVQEGDEVIVFGDCNSISDVAQRMNSIPYEVLTSVSRRVKRVYYQE